MCGLILSIRIVQYRPPNPIQDPLHDAILSSLKEISKCRGPDCQNTYTQILPLADGTTAAEVTLCSSILGLRGNDVTPQPLIGEHGVLGWNGQVFQGLDVGIGENDTRKIFEMLEAGEDVEDILSEIEGPYAIIYLNLKTQKIHFQLDPLSRRSLLIYEPNPSAPLQTFFLTSIRSATARENGLNMRALLGGEGGIIDLKRLKKGDDASLDMSAALTTWTGLPQRAHRSRLVQVAPINATLPPSDLSINEAESSSQAEIRSMICHLAESVRLRVENIPVPPSKQARIAILFSGGIDCTLLAYLVDRCLPANEPIDLINVAFERPPQQMTLKSNRKPSMVDDELRGKGKAKAIFGNHYDVPDRLNGREAVDELRIVCPGREWRFVEVNVEFEECQKYRQEVIDAMYPSATEMDLSLAFPLYFASRGIGVIRAAGNGEYEPYLVKAKVYISGLGADEQLGGYARHRHAYQRGGWQGLVDETQMDITRLPTRNLSRDDRILASHARDARYPYLDLSFISYLSSLPIYVKCDPRLPEGTGDKRLLRLVAASVGLKMTSSRVKRAMQFGTRSSKMGLKQGRGPRAGEQLVE